MAQLIVLTGASGSGKTTLARALEHHTTRTLTVCFFDSIGVPSPEAMLTWGDGHQPGGAWQRAMTIEWMRRIAPLLQAGTSVLLEGQMRIAFIREALTLAHIPDARILLLDCDDATRTLRLTQERASPELAGARMFGWAHYLRSESATAGCDILDTSGQTLAESVAQLTARLAA